MNIHNYAYVTLLSSQDYLLGVLVLNESLKRVNSFFPLVVGITDELYDYNAPILTDAGCYTERIERLTYHQSIIDKWGNTKYKSVLNTASKISLFKLNKWDKLVYIDADCLVLQNIDDLFNWPDGSMLRYSSEQFGFSGLMVFCPCFHNVEYYEIIMKNTGCTDGNLFGDLWFCAKSNPAYQIPHNYLMTYDSLAKDKMLNVYPRDYRDCKVIHFVNQPKPWVDITAFDQSFWYVHYYDELLHTINLNRG